MRLGVLAAVLLVFVVFLISTVGSVTSGQWHLVVGAGMPAAIVVLVGLAVAAAFLVRGSLAERGALLTPARLILLLGNDFSLRRTRPIIVPWEELSAIEAGLYRRGVGQNQVWIRVRDLSRIGFISDRTKAISRWLGSDAAAVIPAGNIAMDPLVFLYTLRFYLDNPAMRQELTHHGGLDRIRLSRLVG